MFRRGLLSVLLVLLIVVSSSFAYALFSSGGGGGGGPAPQYHTCYLDYDGDGHSSAETLYVQEGDTVKTYYSSVQIRNTIPCTSHVIPGIYYSEDQLRFIGTDCNDDDYFTHPDATELCDAVDNNCDGILDNYDSDTKDITADFFIQGIATQEVFSSIPDYETNFSTYLITYVEGSEGLISFDFPISEDSANSFCIYNGFEGASTYTTTQSPIQPSKELFIYTTFHSSFYDAGKQEEAISKFDSFTINISELLAQSSDSELQNLANYVSGEITLGELFAALPSLSQVYYYDDSACSITSCNFEGCRGDCDVNVISSAGLPLYDFFTQDYNIPVEFLLVLEYAFIGEVFESYTVENYFSGILNVPPEEVNVLLNKTVDIYDYLINTYDADQFSFAIYYDNSIDGWNYRFDAPAVVDDITCIEKVAISSGRSVCDFQDDFSYYCEDGVYTIGSYSYTSSGANPKFTVLIPTIEHLDYNATKANADSLPSNWGKRWDFPALDYLTKVFDPDKREEYCRGTACLYDFLEGESNDLTSSLLYDNLCCGDDDFDEGLVVTNSNGEEYVCIKNPNGQFEWINSLERSDFETSTSLLNFVKGNIYSVNQQKYYPDDFEASSLLTTQKESVTKSSSISSSSVSVSFSSACPNCSEDRVSSIIAIPPAAEFVNLELRCDMDVGQPLSDSTIFGEVQFLSSQNEVIGIPIYCNDRSIAQNQERISRNVVQLQDVKIPPNAGKMQLIAKAQNYIPSDPVQLSYQFFSGQTNVVNDVDYSFFPSIISPPDSYAYDLLATDNGWFVCSEQDIDFQYDSKPSQVSENAIVSHSSGGNIHEYLCRFDGEELRFSECRGNTQALNYFYSQSPSISQSDYWSASSADFKGPAVELFTFEDSPTLIEFSDPTQSILIERDSSRVFEGQRSLKIETSISQTFGFNSALTATAMLEKNVSDFEYIQGYVYFDDIAILDIKINDKKYTIEEFIVGKVKTGEWLLFSIPIDSITELNSVSFIMPTSSVNYQVEGTYRYFLDNIYLVDSEKKSFCGAEFIEGQLPVMKWFTDRDDNRQACEGGNGVWTGSKCCGDDVNEYYVDSLGTCWAGEQIPLGARVQPVEFFINDKLVKTFCSDESAICEVELPRFDITEFGGDPAVFTLRNPHPELYNVSFATDGLNTSFNVQDSVTIAVNSYIFAHINDQFLLCGDESFVTDELTNIVTNELIQREQEGICSVAELFVCDGTGWTYNQIIEQNEDGSTPNFIELVNLEFVPEPFIDVVPQPSGCCPNNYCWNGFYCVENQINEPTGELFFSQGNFSGYRCLDGDWILSDKKYSPEGFGFGFCPEESQCYVSDQGLYANNNNLSGRPQCIDNGQYFGEFYCNNGVYESRTKQLISAIQRNFSTNDYTIYCDNYQQVFNYLENVNGNDPVSFIRGADNCRYTGLGFNNAPCINNFCVLNSDNGITFGTTLNQPLDAINFSAADLFSIPDITDCKDSSVLTKCSSSTVGQQSSDWYFDSSTQILINSQYSRSFFSFFTNIFDNLKSVFFSEDIVLSLSYEELSDVIGLEQFIQLGFKDSLYYAKEGDKQVIAINGEIRDVRTRNSYNYVGVEYVGYENICSYLQGFNFQVECETQGDSTYVFIISDTRIPIWTDLSTKLRLFED